MSLRLLAAKFPDAGGGGPGVVWWLLAVCLGLFMGLTVKDGTLYLGGGRKIEKRRQPTLFWSAIGGLGVVVAALLAWGWLHLLPPDMRHFD